MRNDQAKANPTQSDAKERAQSIIEGYHEGNTMEDRLLRKELIISMLICIVSSDWWTAMMHDQRMNIIHHVVQVDDTMDALDVVYGQS
jgi:hypothetical protein